MNTKRSSQKQEALLFLGSKIRNLYQDREDNKPMKNYTVNQRHTLKLKCRGHKTIGQLEKRASARASKEAQRHYDWCYPEGKSVSDRKFCSSVWAASEYASSAPVERRLPANVVGRLERLDAAAFERRQRDKSRATPPRPAPSWADVALWDRYEHERHEHGYLMSWTVPRVRRGMSYKNRWQ